MYSTVLYSVPLCTVQSFTQCLYVQYSPLLSAFMYSTVLYSVPLRTVQSFTQCLYVQYSPLLSAFMYSTVLYSVPLRTVQSFTQCLYVQYSPLLSAFMYSTVLYSVPLCTVQSLFSPTSANGYLNMHSSSAHHKEECNLDPFSRMWCKAPNSWASCLISGTGDKTVSLD